MAIKVNSTTVIDDGLNLNTINAFAPPTGSIVVNPFLGSVNGYATGGLVPAAPGTSGIIDSFPLSTPFVTATVVGSLSGALTPTRGRTAGHSSSSTGYASGGTTSRIDSFPFTVPFNSTTSVATVPQTWASRIGQSSSTDGYMSGGKTPPNITTNVIEKFPFAAPVTITDIGDLSASREVAAGQSSSDTGYTSGGRTLTGTPPTVFSNVIDRFPFSAPFTTATDVGDLIISRADGAGLSGTTNGYTAGGYGTNDLIYYNTIDRFPFSSPFVTATDIGDTFGGTTVVGSGQSSFYKGFHSGGLNFPAVFINTVAQFPFSSPFSTATDTGDLSQVRYGSSGQQY